MAERRMFAKTIIDSDAFLEMPTSCQALYFHLSMRADDDGFVNNPKKIQRLVGSADDDLKILIAKRFIIPFESGICVIKHWRMHNYIQADRYKETVYQDEKKMLAIKPNKSYTIVGNSTMYPECIQDVSSLLPQVRLGKDSIDKDIVIAEKKKRSHFVPPTMKEVDSYCTERKNNIVAEHFIDYYTARNWMLGKVKMKDWKSAVRTWERNDKGDPKSKPTKTDYSF